MKNSKNWPQGLVLCLIAVCFSLNSQQAYAQKAWTLKECVDYALENSISIKQSRISLEIAEGNKDQSMAVMFPNLNGNANQNYLFGRSIDPVTNSFTTSQLRSTSFSLSSQFTIFDGLQLQNQLKRSKLNYLSERYSVEKAADDISLNVVAAFLQVLFGEEAVLNSEKRKENIVEQVDRTQKLLDNGSVPRGTLLDVEAQLATEELTLTNAINVRDGAKLSLLQLLNLDSLSVNDVQLEVPQVDIPDQSVLLANSVDDIYAKAVSGRPEIKSAETAAEGAAMGLKAAQGGRYPTLSIGGSIGTNYSSAASLFNIQTMQALDYPFNDQLEDNFNQAVGFNLSLPIFNGWFTRNSISQARLALESAELNTVLVKNTLYQSVQQAYFDANAAQRTYFARKKAFESLRESTNYLQKRFDVGLTTSVDYVTATNNLAIAQSDLLQAKYDLIFRIKVLDFYLGNEITF